MGRVLFLGNSHIAAYKLAYDAPSSAFPRDCAFFCARAADLAFTRVEGRAIVATERAAMARDELMYFFPDGVAPALEARYLSRGEPLAEVGEQFEQTGGSRSIELDGVDVIFYAAGISPYDTRRLEAEIAPRSPGLTREMLRLMLRDRFLLRNQVRAIREVAPDIRHYLLGMPRRGRAPLELSPQVLAMVAARRAALSRMCGDYVFDDVFMPGESVLAGDLLSVRPEFFVRGRELAEEYQGVPRTQSDELHVNSSYAEVVFDEFIGPRIP